MGLLEQVPGNGARGDCQVRHPKLPAKRAPRGAFFFGGSPWRECITQPAYAASVRAPTAARCVQRQHRVSSVLLPPMTYNAFIAWPAKPSWPGWMTLPRAWARRLRTTPCFPSPPAGDRHCRGRRAVWARGGAGRNRGAIAGLIGQDAAVAVQALVRRCQRAHARPGGGSDQWRGAAGGATTVFAELQSALDRIWHVPQRAKPSGLWAVLRARCCRSG